LLHFGRQGQRSHCLSCAAATMAMDAMQLQLLLLLLHNGAQCIP